MSGHTAGPYFWREYAQDAEDLAQMRSLGMTPTRMLTNEGQVALMAGTGDDVKRIALIDCQTSHKRGQGYKTACAERDANAALFAAAPDLVKALQGSNAMLQLLRSMVDASAPQSSIDEQVKINSAALATLTARKVG
jgi:hypothetical protein